MIESKLKKIFNEVLKVEKVSELNRKNCSNWDSLNHITLISTIEEEFDIEFDIESLVELNSFDNILYKVTQNVNIRKNI